MTEKNKNLIMRISKTPVMYVIYLFVTVIIPALMKYNAFDGYIRGFWTEDMYSALGYAYSLVVLFSLVSIFVLHDTLYRNRFLESEAELKGFWGRLGFVFRSWELWTDVLTFGVLTAIMPGWVYNDFRYVFVAGIRTEWHFPIYLAASLAVFILLSTVAYSATLIWWSRPSEKRRQRREKNKSNAVSLIKQILFSIGMYFLGAMLLPVAIPAVWSVIITFWMFLATMTLMTLTVIGIYVGTKYVRAIHHRRRLLKKMKKAMENGYCRLVKTKRIYSSVFKAQEGANIILKKDGQPYYCKIVTPLRKRYTVKFDEKGWVTVERNILIAKLYKSEKYFMDTEAGAKKIIIVNPGVLHMFANDGLHNRELQSGERTMDYYVYRTDNFINGIERKYL